MDEAGMQMTTVRLFRLWLLLLLTAHLVATLHKQRCSAFAINVLLSRLFLERRQNVATKALPSKDLVSGSVYLLTCELQRFHRLYS